MDRTWARKATSMQPPQETATSSQETEVVSAPHRLLKDDKKRRRSFNVIIEYIMLEEFSAASETDVLDIAKLCKMVKQASSTFTTKVLKSKYWLYD
jgi:hypothetical protein